MVGVVGVVVVVGGLCGAFVHGGCVGCIVCWLMGAWRLLGWLGLWVVVVGWCRLGCGEGCGVWGVCGKAGVGFVLFWRSLFCVSSGNSAALAPRPAPCSTRARGCAGVGGLMDAKPAEGMGGVVRDA